MKDRTAPRILTVMATAIILPGCSPSEPNRLDKLPTVRVTIGGQPFLLWVADSWDEQSKGLMFITAEQMAPLPDGTERGMLFVFTHSVRDSFWMKNTVIPLEVAYVALDGTVVDVYAMAPLDNRHNQYPASAPYRFAVEVHGRRLTELGVKAGDKLEIPMSVLKGTQ